MTLAATLSLGGFDIPLEVVILGAIAGVSYSLFGMGLSITYQSTRVLNFAQGAMGAVPHLLVAKLVIDAGWSYRTALPTALAIGAASGALLELGVIRRLANAPRLVVLVATLAASQLLTVPTIWMVDLSTTQIGRSPYPTPFRATWHIGDLELHAGQILIVLVAPAVLLALTAFLKRTSVGAASRAMAENPEAAELSGIPTHRISLLVWTIAGLLAALAAILNGPNAPALASIFGGGSAAFVGSGSLLMRGLGAAMIGGLTRLPQIFLAGLGIGVVEALVRWNYPSGGNDELAVAILVLAALVVRKDLRELTRGGEEAGWSLAGGVRALPDRIRSLPRVRAARAALIASVVGAAAALPMASSQPKVILYSAILIYILVGLSLVVLTGWAGQVSLGHFTFVALGALVGGRMHQTGHSALASLVIAVGAGALVALVVGVPALRLRGLFLAVTTLAFAVVANAWLVRQEWLVQVAASNSSLRIDRLDWMGIDFQNERTFYYAMLLLVVAACALTYRLRRTGIARSIIAVRENEAMAAALSLSPARNKLLAFVVSGAIASFAGYLYASLLVAFGNAGLTNPALSMQMVTMVILGGATSVSGAILGALYIRGLPYFFDSAAASLLSSGIGLLVVLLFLPGGLASLAFRVRDVAVRLLVGREAMDDEEAATPSPARLRLEPRSAVPVHEVPEVPALEASDILVRFGGLTAVNHVSLHARWGEVVGLIGPNGAGKTTLFDVLSGLQTPNGGRVLLGGHDVTDLPPEERASLGLGRSFQQARLFPEMTVLELFQVALERRERSELIPSMFALPPSRLAEWRKSVRAGQLVDLLGLGDFAEKRAGELSTGTRRVAELGCSIALGAEVLLLDEPTGGIAQREVEAFVPVLRQIQAHLGATMVVIAHDIPMIVDLADRMYVLSSGDIIAEGPPTLLQDDERVIAAYLGADADGEGDGEGDSVWRASEVTG